MFSLHVTLLPIVVLFYYIELKMSHEIEGIGGVSGPSRFIDYIVTEYMLLSTRLCTSALYST